MAEKKKSQRIGRPRKKNPRNYQFAIYVTSAEYDAIWKHLSDTGISSASQLFRELLQKSGII